MCADIYRTCKPDTFVLVPRGGTLESVPKVVLNELGPLEFLNSRELSDSLLSVDTVSSQHQLGQRGFAVQRN